MQTFIPQGHKVTWSHSSLNTFDTCPRRYWAEKIAKNVKDDNVHPTTLWGLEVHKALEDNGKVNKPLPSNMKQYEGYAAALKSVTLKADKAYHEHQMAVNKEAQPVLWSSSEAYGRTIADVLVVSEKTNTAAIIDHKGLATDTLVPTPHGWSTIWELKVGDTVYDMNGYPCRVTAKHQPKNIPCFEIEFDSGQRIVCDEDHEWLRSDGKVVKSTGLSKQRQGQSVPTCGALNGCDLSDIPVSPFTLGAWLSDGRTSGRGEIGKPYLEFWDAIRGEGWTVGPNIAKVGDCEVRTVYGLTTVLRLARLINNKRIPDVYFRASYEVRLALAKGLYNGDGSINKTRKELVFSNTSKPLAEDVAALMRTLGVRATVTSAAYRGFGKTGTVYQVKSRLLDKDVMVVAHKNAAEKLVRASAQTSKRTHVVKSVKRVPSVTTQCITVDSPSSTFLCTTHYIPTHNCGKYRGPSLQPVINAWMVMNHYNVEIVRTQFNYLAEDKSARDVFYRTSIEHDFQPVRELIARLEAAVSYNNFPAIKSGLCRQYCPVHKCPHNGKFTP
jgi:hypothetical protein